MYCGQRWASYSLFSERMQETLQSIVGKNEVSTSVAVREQHGRDESYHKTRSPDAVVFPHSLEQVQEIARFVCVCVCAAFVCLFTLTLYMQGNSLFFFFCQRQWLLEKKCL